MSAKPDRVLSGWRARRLIGNGGLLVRDGLAFRMYLRADTRSSRSGRVPAHVVARLKQAPGLAVFCGDPDRLVAAGKVEALPLKPLPVPVEIFPHRRSQDSALEQVVRTDTQGVRLRAAAARFRADYHLAASPGRLRTDAPKTLAAACARLAAMEVSLGTDQVELVEMLVLDKLTPAALLHVAEAGQPEVREALVGLAIAYGLAGPDQDAGRAFASA